MSFEFDSVAPFAGDLERGYAPIPAEVRAHCATGKRLLHLGRHQEALDAFRDSIRIYPDYPEAHILAAAACLHLGQYAQTVEACKEALHLRPADSYASFYL